MEREVTSFRTQVSSECSHIGFSSKLGHSKSPKLNRLYCLHGSMRIRVVRRSPCNNEKDGSLHSMNEEKDLQHNTLARTKIILIVDEGHNR
ncbi:hypothetical protein KP509_33G012700 [Ceratopteris richardii]|uniref:Uncharacterized protein n=1 Tax=Ceratopteris richardii TaxID=49495 RepID=A0A8T2QNG5_CERRI|nr:hypothetical protein KP509_33G012700 [Ceratopteris richardii]